MAETERIIPNFSRIQYGQRLPIGIPSRSGKNTARPCITTPSSLAQVTYRNRQALAIWFDKLNSQQVSINLKNFPSSLPLLGRNRICQGSAIDIGTLVRTAIVELCPDTCLVVIDHQFTANGIL